MSQLVKSILRFTATRVGVSTYERVLAHSVLSETFGRLRSVPVAPGRQAVWDECLSRVNGPMTYVEFGVHTGVSIRYFAKQNTHPGSLFIGLDSFEGLPEDWQEAGMRKGAFDVQGAIPQIDDPRVSFIKGWFQNTWDQLAPRIQDAKTLVVHYDADLYSSTLFALTKIDAIKRPYLALFDEFAGHEARALHNYLQSYNASVEFLAQTIGQGYPCHVLTWVTPNAAL